jgi:hypothetical protein
MNISYTQKNSQHQFLIALNGKEYTFCIQQEMSTPKDTGVLHAINNKPIKRQKRSAPYISSTTRRAHLMSLLEHGRSYTGREICNLTGIKPNCLGNIIKWNPDFMIKEGDSKFNRTYRLA